MNPPLSGNIALSISQTDISWLAGIIDADGCVYANRRGPHGRGICYRIEVGTDDARPMREVKKIVSELTGSKYRFYTKKSNPTFLYFSISRKRDLQVLLPHIIPYLRFKKTQAELLGRLVQRSWRGRGTPDWAYEVVEQIQWRNRHRLTLDGTWVPTKAETKRQSRGKPATREPVEAIRGAPFGEEMVQTG